MYVVHEFPVTSQTFVENEALALEELGYSVLRYPIHHNEKLAGGGAFVLTAKDVFTTMGGLLALISVLCRGISRLPEILRVLAAERPRWRDYAGQIFALTHAISLSSQLHRRNQRNVHLHGHFLGRCLDVVSYARILLGSETTTSATAHAADASNPRTPNRFRLQVNKLNHVFCASESVAKVLAQATGRDASAVIHCGITPQPSSSRRGSGSTRLRLLTVARQVEKKGLDDCLAAAIELKNLSVDFEWRFIGDGPMSGWLRDQSRSLTDQGLVTWMGAQPSSVVYDQLTNWADAFVLPCRLSSSGDVDGIPVALMEAMTSSVAVISSRISGIPELISHNESGVLITPGNVPELVAGIVSLTDVAFRNHLVHAGKKFVDRNFNQLHEARKLGQYFLSTEPPQRTA